MISAALRAARLQIRWRPRRAAGEVLDGLVDELVQVTFATMAALTRLSAQHDLSPTQLRVLAILRDRRLRMTDLAEYLGLDKSTMTGLVDRAETRGLLQRAPNGGDRRAVDVFLGPDGVQLAGRLTVEVRRSLAPMIGHLAAADQRRLQALLQRMLSAGRHRQA